MCLTVSDVPDATFDLTTPEGRVLAAAVRCVDRWGFEKVTVDDISAEAGISRATLYRLFPGGRDVLFEAIRSQETMAFFADLDVHVQAADTLDELVVSILIEATIALRTDDRLQVMLASRPGEVLKSLGFADQPRIIAAASAFLQPRVARFIDAEQAHHLADWMVRVVLSYFFTPSEHVDLANPVSAAAFARSFVLPAFAVAPSPQEVLP
jgi:AcrR family transcriptional regulator